MVTYPTLVCVKKLFSDNTQNGVWYPFWLVAAKCPPNRFVRTTARASINDEVGQASTR